MEKIEQILQQLRTGQPKITVNGLGASSISLLLSILCTKTPGSILLLTSHHDQAEQFVSDLELFLRIQGCKIPVVLFPPLEVPTAWSASLQREITGHRMNALSTVLQEKQTLLVAPLIAALQAVPRPQWLRRSTLRLQKGDAVERDGLLDRLIDLGYQRVNTVERPGEYAARGGIVDLYGSSLEQPVRFELAGDSLESIRTFDSITQRSMAAVESFMILPASEDDAASEESSAPSLSSSGLRGGLFEYFDSPHLLALDEPELLSEKSRELMKEKPLASPWKLEHDGIRQVIEFRALALASSEPAQPRKEILTFDCKSPAGIGLGIKTYSLDQNLGLLDKLRGEINLFIVCRSHDQQQRLQDILAEHDLLSSRWTTRLLEGSPSDVPSELHLVVGHLSSGLIVKELGLGFISEEEIFGRTTARPVKRAKIRPFLTSFEDLRVSDYVVHLHYGIGRFLGLQRLTITGFESDFLVIQYAEGGKVYVPLDHLDLVQKYIGSEGSVPRIDRLGTVTWNRTKQRVKKEVEKMAGDLLNLYATREVIQGYKFSSDSLTSREFEASFEYEETPDQLRAIDEVRGDMEVARPMDRVVCGDVGYGKTEVAMRAALKAVLDNKQVALLVPTTLLAQQHFQTLSQRFSAFPIRVEALSRFKAPKEQKAITRDLAEGKVDIIIGTHRLLQKDIYFQDLGLVIIDEEQRFGVAHKERFKHLRKTVDVLTLTATPIPRTLQMAFVGVRDLSIIDTPPPDRLAVKTIVAQFDKNLIREAILRELERKGQVFFVHNRVKGIDRMGFFLKELVPEAKIAIAHGQMRERELERVMLKFLQRDYNLLLSTAIIESGLDIPTANTIIINRADQFGLAELYQLRGRVGRSSSQAYAYLLVPDRAVLTEDAKKRLTALQEFSELGSGFKIAARDLEIRGAGSLLGKQQSGQIAAIGFELYLNMIEQAVQQIKGHQPEEEIDPSLNLRVSAYLPEDYIADSYQRLVIYKRMASCIELNALESIREELIDRFGPLPPPVEYLVHIIQIKILARSLRITQIESKLDALVIVFHPTAVLTDQAIRFLIDKYQQKLRFPTGFSLQIKSGSDRWDDQYQTLRAILQDLAEKQQCAQ